MKRKKNARRVLLFAVLVFVFCCLFGVTVFASGSDTSGGGIQGFASGMAYIGAGLSTGVAAIGGGIAVGGGAPAAIGALTEDPKSFGKSLIFVALGEGIALYGMLISILILNNA